MAMEAVIYTSISLYGNGGNMAMEAVIYTSISLYGNGGSNIYFYKLIW